MFCGVRCVAAASVCLPACLQSLRAPNLTAMHTHTHTHVPSLRPRKIFGYPSGLGALLVHKAAARHLRKVYFGGGSVDYW
jgi:hypothetical protein